MKNKATSIRLDSHLYFINEERCSIGDYILIDGKIDQMNKVTYCSRRDVKKVVATTDSSLNLPSISNEIIQLSNLKLLPSKISYKIEVDYGLPCEKSLDICKDNQRNNYNCKGCPLARHRMILLVEKQTFTRDEVIELCTKVYEKDFSKEEDFTNWIEQL